MCIFYCLSHQLNFGEGFEFFQAFAINKSMNKTINSTLTDCSGQFLMIPILPVDRMILNNLMVI